MINKNGNTPLLCALQKRNSEKIIKLLLNEKSNINQKNNFGETAFICFLKNYSKVFIRKLFYLFKDFILLNDLVHITIEKKKLDFLFELKPDLLINKDFFNWKYSDYLYWKTRMFKILYLLVFSY